MDKSGIELPALDEIVVHLAEYVALPSVSRSADGTTMQETAEWLARQLAFAAGRVEQTAGFPVVRAEWTAASDAPVVLVYGHYDVQPTGSLDEWATKPFDLAAEIEPRGDRGRAVIRSLWRFLILVTRAARSQKKRHNRRGDDP